MDPESDVDGEGVKETGEVFVGVAGSGLLVVVLIEDRLEVRIPSWASFGLRPDLAGDWKAGVEIVGAGVDGMDFLLSLIGFSIFPIAAWRLWTIVHADPSEPPTRARIMIQP